MYSIIIDRSSCSSCPLMTHWTHYIIKFLWLKQQRHPTGLTGKWAWNEDWNQSWESAAEWHSTYVYQWGVHSNALLLPVLDGTLHFAQQVESANAVLCDNNHYQGCWKNWKANRWYVKAISSGCNAAHLPNWRALYNICQVKQGLQAGNTEFQSLFFK